MPIDIEARLRHYRGSFDAAVEVASKEGFIAPSPYVAASAAPRRGRLRPVFILATAAVVVAVGMLVRDSVGVRTLAPAAPPTTAARPDSIRVVVDLPGWRISRADEHDGGGQMTFTDGKGQAELTWEKGDATAFEAKVENRAAESDLREAMVIAGTSGVLLRYTGTSDYLGLWGKAGTLLELRGTASNPEDFAKLLAALRPVDEATWLAALPKSAVTPDERSSTIDELLADVPLPPGFDKESLRSAAEVKGRYQLGAQVVGAVTCGWITDWVSAKRAGDAARVAAAVEALGTSRQWPVLLEMESQGGYPGVVWQYADGVAADGTVMGGRRLTVETSYRDAFGCD